MKLLTDSSPSLVCRLVSSEGRSCVGVVVGVVGVVGVEVLCVSVWAVGGVPSDGRVVWGVGSVSRVWTSVVFTDAFFFVSVMARA